jgi:hypothetical protein
MCEQHQLMGRMLDIDPSVKKTGKIWAKSLRLSATDLASASHTDHHVADSERTGHREAKCHSFLVYPHD